MLQNRLCEQLGITVPIWQAPIGGVSNPQLAAAVSNGGGLGMIALTWRSVEYTLRILRETQALTEKPFAVNYVLNWDVADQVAACLKANVKLFSFFWGDPSAHVKRIHDAGGTVIHTVGSSREAIQSVENGVDIVVAQGWEAGGHVRGEVSTLALVPAVIDAVAPIPVVAAGGIADGRTIAAALALGAAGVMIGTRFVVCDEANSHSVYRQEIIEATEAGTVYTSLFDIGWKNAPHRTLRNSTYENWRQAGCPPSGHRPGEHEIVSRVRGGREIRRYDSDAPTANIEGRPEEQALYAGQGVGLIRDCKSAAETLACLVGETEQAILRLQRYLSQT